MSILPNNADRSWHRYVILSNIIWAGLIGSLSGNAGFISESTSQLSFMLGNDAMRWIGISFIMMLGVTLPLAVFFAERFGYKKIFFYGQVIFLFGSFFNSIASGFTSLLIARMIAGVGAGALFPLSVAIINRTFPKEQVVIALALYVGCVFGIGGSSGYLIGGYLSQYVSSEAPFFVCFLMGLPVLPMIHVFHKETESKQELKFDTPGYIAFIIFIASIFIILVSGKSNWNTEGWSSAFLIFCYALAIISLILFIYIELKSQQPIILFSLFKTQSFLLGCLAIFFVGASLYPTMQLGVTFLDVDLGYAKHVQGVYLATLGLTMGSCSACTSWLSKKINIRYLAMIGLIIVTLSCWINPVISIYSTPIQFLGIWNLRMFGIGLSLGPATALALSDIKPAVSGAAAVLITFFRQVGGTIGALSTKDVVLERTTFHQESFGSQVDLSSPALQKILFQLKHHLTHHLATHPNLAEAKATALVRENLVTQSHAASINDAFYLIGWVTFICFLGLIIELITMNRNKQQS